MATRKTSSDPYREVKKMFEQLDLPRKGAFVVEAFFVTLAEALEEVGEAIARVIEQEFEPSEQQEKKGTRTQRPSNGARRTP